MVGLGVDSVRKTQCVRRAENVAAQAARAGADAAAAHQIVAASARHEAMSAAYGVLNDEGVSGTVTIRGDVIEVQTSTTQPTVFLSIVGIDQISAEGSATARTQQR